MFDLGPQLVANCCRNQVFLLLLLDVSWCRPEILISKLKSIKSWERNFQKCKLLIGLCSCCLHCNTCTVG